MYFNKNEHLTQTSISTLSNEAVQTMGSVLNTGNGIINNLTILGTLKVGKTIINSDGSIKIGNTVIDTNGNITGATLNWNGTENNWTLGPEGNFIELKNSISQNNSNGNQIGAQYSFIGDGNIDFGQNTVTSGTFTAYGDITTGGNMISDVSLRPMIIRG